MIRQNLFSDAWDGDDREARTRHRIFWRPDGATMGATLYELAPGAPDLRLHMHFGTEEMFFVLSGRPVFRNQQGEESWIRATSSSVPTDVPDYTRSAIPPRNQLRSSRSVPGASRTSSPTPKTDMHGWRLGIPIPSYSQEAATPASSLASRSRSSRSFGRLSAVARHSEEAARAASSSTYTGSTRRRQAELRSGLVVGRPSGGAHFHGLGDLGRGEAIASRPIPGDVQDDETRGSHLPPRRRS